MALSHNINNNIQGIGTAIVDSTTNFIGNSIVRIIGTATADSVANFKTIYDNNIGTATADSEANFIGNSFSSLGVGVSVADSVVNFIGNSNVQGTGIAVADSVANFIGNSNVQGTGIAVTDSTTNFIGSILIIDAGTAISTANSVANFIGSSIIQHKGAATANSVVNFIGSSKKSKLAKPSTAKLIGSNLKKPIIGGHSATYTTGDMPIYSEPVFGIDELWPSVTMVSTYSSTIATITPMGIPGTPIGYGYDLAGTFAILPDPKKRFKYIEIRFTFNGDKYEYQLYKEKQITVSINNIKRTPKWQKRPKVSLENFEGLIAWKN